MSKLIPFTHLHGHSKYSFKDGHGSFENIIATAKENGQTAIAVTDHGYMWDALGFYLKAKDAGIKPIIGCEVYAMPEGESINVRKSTNPDDESDDDYVKYFHLVLIAKDADGLENLHKICSIANDENHFYYKPRVKREDLEKYHEGIICLSACLGGEVPMLITHNKIKEAVKVAKLYKKIFGDDYYLEVQDQGIEIEPKVNRIILKISDKLGIDPVLTNDYHYCKRENYEDHKLLKCTAYKEDFHNAKNYDTYFPTPNFYIRPNEEMLKIAKKYKRLDIYENTSKIAEKCDVKIDMQLHFPKADLEGKYKTADEKLLKLTHELAPTKYDMDDEETANKVNSRLAKEISDIRKGQFPDYFLNVYDIVKYAKDNGILIGSGRGSGAGSIVSNILNITDVDPIYFDLIWERFWNPGRCTFAVDSKIVKIIKDVGEDKYKVKFVDTNEEKVVSRSKVKIIKASPPDLDIDVPSNRRDEVIGFCKDHFGYYRVANIVTFGTYKCRNLIRDGGKALGIDEDLINKIINTIPYKGSPSLSWCLDNVNDLIDIYNEDDEAQDFMERLLRIEGCCINSSTHAGGLLITDVDMFRYTPVFEGKNGLTTQYPYETLEAIGCLKIDLLGHEAEEIIDNTCMLIKERHNIIINPYKIPMNDKKTFKLFRDIRMNGIPQLQADWVIPIIQDVQPKDIEDIIALVTMIRPGSLNSGQTDKYRDACKGIPVKPDVPELEPIVDKYNMCLLYQEQIMELAKQLGGFTLEEADTLRKVCAKTKYKNQADKMLQALKSGMEEKKIPENRIKKICDIVIAFFAYSFNKAHAAGYGVTTYRIGYLKAHYFLELTTSQLNAVIGDQEKTQKFLDEVIEEGYDVLPPDINKSLDVWTCDDEGVRFPLDSINGVGPACAEAILQERELKGDYKSFEDFILRLPGQKVKKTAVDSLSVCGAFCSLGYTRQALWEQSDDVIALLRNKKKQQGKVLLGPDAGKKLGVEIKPMKEFKLKEIQEDEKNYLGFTVTMTKEDKEILVKRLQRRSAKLRGDSDTAHFQSKKKEGLNNRVKEKLKKLRERMREDNDGKEGEKEDIDDISKIKDKVKSKLNIINHNVVKKEEKEKKNLVIVIDDQNISPARIFACTVKFKSGNKDIRVIIKLKLEDGNYGEIITNYYVKNDEKLFDKLKKIVGKDNVWLR
jgi:DNA polymerase-3 subunit alpha